MNDDRLNLDPLDPTRDNAFVSRVAGIATDAMAARRGINAARRTLLGDLGAWLHPALVGAGLVAAACLVALVAERAPGSPAPSGRGAAASEILGIPAPLVALARSTQAPSVTQLVAALSNTEQGAARGR
jgi:hypothetical protein